MANRRAAGEPGPQTLVYRSTLTDNPNLPDAELTLDIITSGRPRVVAGYVRPKLAHPPKGALAQRELDAGAVVVDVDSATAEIRGIEVLRYAPAPSELPEWQQAVADSGQPFLLAGVFHLMAKWAVIQLALDDPQVKDRLTTLAEAEQQRWREPEASAAAWA